MWMKIWIVYIPLFILFLYYANQHDSSTRQLLVVPVTAAFSLSCREGGGGGRRKTATHLASNTPQHVVDTHCQVMSTNFGVDTCNSYSGNDHTDNNTNHKNNNSNNCSSSSDYDTTTLITTRVVLQYIPSQIMFYNVTQYYPSPNIIRQLFSSIPYRPFAIQNISFTLLVVSSLSSTVSSLSLSLLSSSIVSSLSLSSQSSHYVHQTPITTTNKVSTRNSNSNNYNHHHLYNHNNNNIDSLLLLTGASSSGKSTILRTIVKPTPTSGNVIIRTIPTPLLLLSQSSYLIKAKPILLDAISIVPLRLQYEKVRTLYTILLNDIVQTINEKKRKINSNDINNCHDTTTIPQAIQNHGLVHNVQLFSTTSSSSSIQHLIETITPYQLSLTQQYKLVIIRACIYSIFGGNYHYNCSNNNIKNTTLYNHNISNPNAVLSLPGPILLFDECFDLETTILVQTIQSILLNLSQQIGMIGIVTTHYVHKWKSYVTIQQQNQQQQQSVSHKQQCITLCRGEILYTTDTTGTSTTKLS
jgi:energy-coupling factor transporter ATP-binding protein EcfA2